MHEGQKRYTIHQCPNIQPPNFEREGERVNNDGKYLPLPEREREREIRERFEKDLYATIFLALVTPNPERQGKHKKKKRSLDEPVRVTVVCVQITRTKNNKQMLMTNYGTLLLNLTIPLCKLVRCLWAGVSQNQSLRR